jgi:hypothetical protein
MKILLVLTMSLLVFACSSDDSVPREETIGKEIADGFNESMDKARDIENQMMEQKEKMDEALRQAEGIDQDP